MPGDHVGIGAVIEQLAEDFPEVTISKVRFLESEGLVSPARTASGYRKFSPDDIERLRFVLTAQRDRYWPLKVIRERLDAADRGLTFSEDGVPTPQGEEEATVDGDRLDLDAVTGRPLRLTPIELQQAADIDTATFRELVSYGLLPKHQEHFDEGDLGVARAAGALVGAGIDVRHLRPFKSAAERELGLADHVLGQQALRGREAGDEGLDDATVARRVIEDCLELHVALLRRGLHAAP